MLRVFQRCLFRKPMALFPLRSYKSLQESQEERKEQKERDMFVKDMKFFLSKENFSLHDFHERVLVGRTEHSTHSSKRARWRVCWRELTKSSASSRTNVRLLHSRQNMLCALRRREEQPIYHRGHGAQGRRRDSPGHDRWGCWPGREVWVRAKQKAREMKGFHGWLIEKRDNGEEIP